MPPRTKYRKCPRCGERKELNLFPKSGSYCKTCRNQKNTERRTKNIRFRLRHHIATRVEKQLQKLNQERPDNLVGEIEKYIGYPVRALKNHLNQDLIEREGKTLKEALDEGYHLDHIKPLSSFVITSLVCEEFRRCWHYSNLSMIPAVENLAKGAKYNDNDNDNDPD